MPNVTPEQKQGLRDAGLWDRFLVIREDLKTQGVKASDAAVMAFNEVAESPVVSAAADKGAAGSSSSSSPSGPLDIGTSQSDHDLIKDRTASEVDTIRWVARNISSPKPDIAKCPDPTALGMLAFYQKFPQQQAKFWETIFRSIVPSKSQLEERVVEAMDGSEQILVIKRIQDVSEKLKGEVSVDG